MLIYEYRDSFQRVIDVYEATRSGKNVPLDSEFWEEVEEEVKKLKVDLRLYKHDDLYGQVLDAYFTMDRAVKKIIDARIYRIFIAIWKGENEPQWLSEPERQFYNDLKALIEDFKAKLVPSLFSKEVLRDGEC